MFRYGHDAHDRCGGSTPIGEATGAGRRPGVSSSGVNGGPGATAHDHNETPQEEDTTFRVGDASTRLAPHERPPLHRAARGRRTVEQQVTEGAAR